jgi:hypothetical protein
MLADYVLQTNWLVGRKVKPDGLLLHGLMVLLMSVFVLPAYLNVVLVPILIMTVLHTAQDWVKITTAPRLKNVHGFYTYMADQVAHYITIFILNALVIGSLANPPNELEIFVMSVGACVVAITRFYEVTWWANFLQMEMLGYFNRWRIFEYAEHLAMFALSVAGLFYLAPLCVLPRLFYSRRTSHSVFRQKYGLLEMGIGIVFSIVLGLLMNRLFPAALR